MFENICWPLKLCLRDFAEQSLHCSIILRSKEQSLRDFAGQGTKALWFRGVKSALLHNFAGQSLHCSMILRGKDMDFRAKIQQEMRFSCFLKKYFNTWQVFQRSIRPWWPLFRKKINCRTVPLTLTHLPWTLFTLVCVAISVSWRFIWAIKHPHLIILIFRHNIRALVEGVKN